MDPFRSIALPALVVCVLAATPAAAQLFKWVDDNGITHYSDRKPDDPKEARGVKEVSAAVSVFEQDPAVLRAVEAARAWASRPPQPAMDPEPAPRPSVAPALTQQPPEPCFQENCGGFYYPYGTAGGHFRRRAVPLAQARLQPGAIAGTVNSPGIIPGNTGSTGNLPPAERPWRPRPGGAEPRFVQYEPARR
ncbi:MAG: DUF4124 domain-containing protein [Burkholderiales bacterium]|nr:DUF4124 domain-containing protein [Burkholderiales bacterium]